MIMRHTMAWTAACASLACAPTTRDRADTAGVVSESSAGSDSGDGQGDTDLTDEDGSSATTGDGTDEPHDGDTNSGSTTDGIRLDVASGETGGGEGGRCPDGNCDGCTAVDLLFVIDNSISMQGPQFALAEAFPQFASAIVESLPPGTNLHVGVTSTEMGFADSGTLLRCVGNTDMAGNPPETYYQTPDTDPSATNGAQGRLFVADGRPFFELDTDAGPADVEALENWFRAASAVGTVGSNIEMSAAAAAWALDPANDGTNAGFLRDEGAVLVMFFVQDEADHTPSAVLPDLLDKITAAKAGCGGLECVVGGGFVNTPCLPAVPLGGMLDAFSDASAIETLQTGQGVTADAFVPVLRDTLASVIARKCDEIPPVG